MKKKIDTGIIVKEAKKGSGVYYLFLNKHSYRVAYSVGSFDDAVDLGIKIQPRFRRDPVGTIQAFKDKPATSMTFKQVAEDWIDNVKKPQVSSWTLERYQQVADDYVFPNLGRKPVESITTGVFSAFIEKQYKADKKRGKGTGNIEICRTVVSGTVKRARSRYSIQMPDPTVGVFEALGLLRNKKLESQRTVKFMTDDQIITYLETALEYRPNYYVMFTLMYNSGLRFGEALGLNKGDIDFKNGTIHIQRSFKRGKIGPTKNKQNRKLGLDKSILAMLKEHIQQMEASGQKGEQLFPHPHDGGYISQNTARNNFKWVYLKSKLPLVEKDGEMVPMWPHTARHSFATNQLAQNPNNLALVSKYLGHTDIAVTQNVYDHNNTHQLPGAAPILPGMGKKKRGKVIPIRKAG